jgi:hypothetical protein
MITSGNVVVWIALVSSSAASILSLRSYVREDDVFYLLASLFFTITAVLVAIRLRTQRKATAPEPFEIEGAGRAITRMIGLAGACWLLTTARVRGGAAIADPLNVFLLVISLASSLIALQFYLRLRESKRKSRST